jgi:integrase
MPSVAAKHPNGEGSLRAIQALMCELGADPPGYFDPFPRQPLQWAIVDPGLPPMLRCLEWVRFHTMCYDGVPKNAQGDPQRSPYCVGLDGKRLNRLDCARETGLSTSVVNRQFASLERLGYIQVKKDGSIWYRGKVEPRAEAAVRQSVAECLQGPRTQSAEPAQPALQRLVAERVIPASSCRKSWTAFAVKRFVRYLIEQGAAPSLLPSPDDTARGQLRHEYEEYLRNQRGLSERTIYHCWRFADRFQQFRLIGLVCRDVALGTGAHVRCEGTGRKQRATPLRKDTAKIIGTWLEERAGRADEPVFNTIRGSKLSRDAVEQIVRRHTTAASKACASLIGKRVSPHVLRHSTAMELLQNGVDRSVIAL